MNGKTVSIYVEHTPEDYVSSDISITISRKPSASDAAIFLIGDIMLAVNKAGGVVADLAGSDDVRVHIK